MSRQTSASDHTTDAISALIADWAAAEGRGDDDAIAGLLVDDFRLVGPLGFILTKDQMRERYHTGDLKHTSFVVKEPAIRVHGDCAIIIAEQDQKTTYRDRDASGRFRITLVALREDDRWRFAGMHLSPIANPPAPAA